MADNIQVQDAMYSYFVMGFQMHMFEEDYIQTGVNLGWINEGQADALRMQFFPNSLKDKSVVSADTPTAKNSESAVPPSSEIQSQPSSNSQSESSSKPASDSKPTSASPSVSSSKPASDSEPTSAPQSASSSNSDKSSESASKSENNSLK